MDKLRLFSTQTDYEDEVANLEYPTVSYIEGTEEVAFMPPPDYSTMYLTFEALENGTFTLTIGKNVPTSLLEDVSYSLDKGKTWTTVQNQDNEEVVITTPIVESYNNVLWKGNGISTSIVTSSTVLADMPASSAIFSSDGKFNIEGNIMSLLYGSNYQNQTSFEDNSTSNFALLFSKANIVSIENLVMPVLEMKETSYLRMFQKCSELTKSCKLPATTLADYCYQFMFGACTSLTTAPELPATTLAERCYKGIFYNCTGLITAPSVLPATTLASSCYENMFQDCTSLTTAPELPATTLADYCYGSMFYRCTSLTTAPVLPATTLVSYCYQYMFRGCTSLTTAPELPATTLASYCYREMFSGCTKLNYIKAMFTTTPSTSYTNNWVSGVAASGTFVKNSAATWTTTGVNGVPSGWTVQTA